MVSSIANEPRSFCHLHRPARVVIRPFHSPICPVAVTDILHESVEVSCSFVVLRPRHQFGHVDDVSTPAAGDIELHCGDSALANIPRTRARRCTFPSDRAEGWGFSVGVQRTRQANQRNARSTHKTSKPTQRTVCEHHRHCQLPLEDPSACT